MHPSKAVKSPHTDRQSNLSMHLFAQQRETKEKNTHLISLKRGLDVGILNHLPVDELNINFQKVLDDIKNDATGTNMNNDTKSKRTDRLSARKGSALANVGLDVLSTRQDSELASNRVSNRTNSTTITDRSIKMEKKAVIAALEQALIKNESPDMQLYRNKYIKRLEAVKEGREVYEEEDQVDTKDLGDLLKILTPLDLKGDANMNKQPNCTLIDHQPGHAFHQGVINRDRYMSVQAHIGAPLYTNQVMLQENNGRFFSKKMFNLEQKFACQKSTVDLTMPQSTDKISLDMKLQKDEIKKNLISPPAGMKMDNKHTDKINNIKNDAETLKNAYLDEGHVKASLRRYAEPSQGDSIFHKDQVNQYLRDTMIDMSKNHSIKQQADYTQRKKEIIDPRSLRIWEFPVHENIDQDMRRSPVAEKITAKKMEAFKKLKKEKEDDAVSIRSRRNSIAGSVADSSKASERVGILKKISKTIANATQVSIQKPKEDDIFSVKSKVSAVKLSDRISKRSNSTLDPSSIGFQSQVKSTINKDARKIVVI